jgi:hypothetical protein
MCVIFYDQSSTRIGYYWNVYATFTVCVPAEAALGPAQHQSHPAQSVSAGQLVMDFAPYGVVEFTSKILEITFQPMDRMFPEIAISIKRIMSPHIGQAACSIVPSSLGICSEAVRDPYLPMVRMPIADGQHIIQTLLELVYVKPEI